MKKMYHLSSQKMILIASLYFATVLNLSFWRFILNILEVNSVAVFIFAVSLPFFIFLTLWMFFNLVLVKYLAKPVLIFLLAISSAASYAMYNYGIFIDSDMYRNVIETDASEINSLVTFKSLLGVFLSGVLPIIALFMVRVTYTSFAREALRRTLNILLSLAILSGFAAVSYKEYVSFGRNHNEVRKLINPFNYLYAAGRYYQKEALKNKEFVVLDAAPQLISQPEEPKKLFLIVLGETARAENFSLYGYPRETNPLLGKENLAVFKDTVSCGTATAVSVPCMFSHMKQQGFDVIEAKFTQNLLDIAQSAGYEVLWRENDGGCKGVCDRVPTEDLRKLKDNDFCRKGSCFDEILLKRLDEKLQNLHKDTIIVLHMMGSHGPTYFERYPERFRKFVPTCDTADLQNCSREEIINTYDNTILYTDYVVAKTINLLKTFPQYQTVMLYVSDHGESLGENNIYLHGLPYKIAPRQQTEVPMVLWMSDMMKQQKRLNWQKLQTQASEGSFSHDNLFHTLLNLMEVRSTAYDQKLDILEKYAIGL